MGNLFYYPSKPDKLTFLRAIDEVFYTRCPWLCNVCLLIDVGPQPPPWWMMSAVGHMRSSLLPSPK